MDKDILQVALQLRKKTNVYAEVFDLTRQLQDVMSRNDDKSIKLIMNMRKDAMLSSEPIELELQRLIENLSPDKQLEVRSQMNKRFDTKGAPVGTYPIYDIHMGGQAVLERTIDIDKRLQMKFNMVKNRKTVAEINNDEESGTLRY